MFLEVAGGQEGNLPPPAGTLQVTKAGQEAPSGPLFLQGLLAPTHRDLGVQL